MSSVLIIGATRGLGKALASTYASRGWNVVGTARSASAPSDQDSSVKHWATSIDISQLSGPVKLAKDVASHGPFDVTIISAGFFGLESFDDLNWEKEITMYVTSAIAPPFIVKELLKAGALKEDGGKIILVGSESGSVTLRHEKEGGGNYGHHGSKAAVNMVGKLLSLDLKGKGIAVGVLHPGFMRTEMTAGVGFDKYWDEGGGNVETSLSDRTVLTRSAVRPEEAAKSMIDFIEDFSMDRTGEYWAPRGPGDIGTAEDTLGKNLPTPLKLPY